MSVVAPDRSANLDPIRVTATSSDLDAGVFWSVICCPEAPAARTTGEQYHFGDETSAQTRYRPPQGAESVVACTRRRVLELSRWNDPMRMGVTLQHSPIPQWSETELSGETTHVSWKQKAKYTTLPVRYRRLSHHELPGRS
jgi:hypothetical protein